MIDDLDESLPLKVLNIPNIHANSLKVMLKYIYGCDLAIDRSVVIDLLLNGIYLGLTFIAQAAGKYIEETCIRQVCVCVLKLRSKWKLRASKLSITNTFFDV